MAGNLTIRAGRRAREILHEEGLNLERIRVLAGASGGPKWLVLSGMDLALAKALRGRRRALLCIGSSIGSWRLAALAQEDGEEAIRTFEDLYIRQVYERRPSAAEVTGESRRIQDTYISDPNIKFMLQHPFMRLAFLAVRNRWPGSLEGRLPQAAHLAAAFAANAINRRLLAGFYQRTLFRAPGFDTDAIGDDGFQPQEVELTTNNFRDAVLASGSIPLVMEGMRDLADTPAGTYRDGGVIDYHMNLPFSIGNDELVFMPHFFEHMTPGWFDKKLKRRKPSNRGVENMVLVAPSADFVATLPGGKVPDRADFATFHGRDNERMSMWRGVVDRCRVLGDELAELFETPGSKINVLPLEQSTPHRKF